MPSPTLAVSPPPTPSPSEYVFVPSKHIPDIKIEEGKNAWPGGFYEDDWNIYKIKKLKGNDFNSLCSINKVTGKVTPVLDRCGSFCFEGEYIYWVENDSANKIYNIKRYDTQTKENTAIYTSDKCLYHIRVYNGNIYFVMDRTTKKHQWSSCSGLYSIDMNGQNLQKLIEDVGYCQLYENKIIYEPSGIYGSDFNSVFVYNIDSKEIKEFGRCMHQATFSVAYGNLCFYNEEDSAFVSINIESGKKYIIERYNYVGDLMPEDLDAVYAVGQYIFYFNDYGLRAYDVINDKCYNITDDVYSFFSSNRNLYGEDDHYIELVKISGGKASIEEVKGLN